jgi:DNA-binding beta-propeller fold protein YncE
VRLGGLRPLNVLSRAVTHPSPRFGPRPRHPGRAVVAALGVAVLLAASLLSVHGIAVASAATSQSATASAAPLRFDSASPSAESSVGAVSGVSAGSVVDTAYVNYNASSPGNFPSTVWNWATGQPAIDPTTGEYWVPSVPIALAGVIAPDYGPTFAYSPSSNSTQILPNLSNASALAFDNKTGLLYATLPRTDSVVEYNPVTAQIVGAPIRVGVDPNAVVYDSRTGYLLVANFGSGNISVINTTTDRVQPPGVPTGSNPVALVDDTSDRVLYVANEGSSNLSRIELPSLGRLPATPTLDPPTSLAYSAQTDVVAVGEPSAIHLSLLDGSTGVTENFATVGRNVSAVAANENGTEFATANRTGTDLTVVAASTGTIESTTFRAGSDPDTLTLDDTTDELYVWSNGSRTITIANLSSRSILQQSPDLGVRPANLAYDPIANEVVSSDRTANAVDFLNVSTFDSAAPPILLPGEPNSVVDDPASGTVYVGFFGGIEAIDVATHSIVMSATDGGNNSNLLVDSQDGLLWDLNELDGLTSFHIPSLTVDQVVGIGAGTVNVNGLALDNSTDELFVTDLLNHTIAVLDAATGGEILPWITGVPFAASVAYDSADGMIYALGHSVWVINPNSRTVVAGPIAIGPNYAAWSITFDPSRDYLYVATSDLPLLAANLTVIDGSSVAASEGSIATIALGQLALTVAPVILPGSSAPGSGEIWAPNDGSGTISIIASPPQITFLSASPNPVDVGVPSQILLGYVGGAGPSQINYTGLPPNCVSSDTPSLNCTPEAKGTYWVNATVVDSLGFTTVAQTLLSVSPAITVVVTLGGGYPTAVDFGTNLSGSADARGGTAPYNYTWTFGDNGVAWGPKVTHLYAAPAVYLVTVVVRDCGGGVASASQTFTVVPLPRAYVSASPSNTTDINTPIEFAANVTGGSIITNESWTFGDGDWARGTTVTHQYATSGVYFATFHYVDFWGSYVNESINVLVNPTLSATMTIDGSSLDSGATVGSSVPFVAQVHGGTAPFTVEWSFGDGSFGTGLSTSHTYGSAGTYNVTLYIEDAVGEMWNQSYHLAVGAASGTFVLGTDFDSGLLLGLIIGAAVAAVILFATMRAGRSPPTPPPPSPYVPPAPEAATVEETRPWNED